MVWDGETMDYAYRVSYKEFVGPIPRGKLICHHCDVPMCIRPDHLFVGDHVSNYFDSLSKGRRVESEKHWFASPCTVK